jgi:hypothetical protein
VNYSLFGIAEPEALKTLRLLWEKFILNKSTAPEKRLGAKIATIT